MASSLPSEAKIDCSSPDTSNTSFSTTIVKEESVEDEDVKIACSSPVNIKVECSPPHAWGEESSCSDNFVKEEEEIKEEDLQPFAAAHCSTYLEEYDEVDQEEQEQEDEEIEVKPFAAFYLLPHAEDEVGDKKENQFTAEPCSMASESSASPYHQSFSVGEGSSRQREHFLESGTLQGHEEDSCRAEDALGSAELESKQPQGQKNSLCGKKIHTCKLCSYTTPKRSHFYEHMRTHTRERPFSCDECQATYFHKSHLVQHMRSHSGEKRYLCETCSSAFSQLGHLKRHRLSHTGEKPYKCDECSAAFSEVGTLKKHQRIHSGERPFKCSMCSAAFSQVAHLNSHKRSHTGEKPYICDACPSTFSELSNLKRHKRVHTGERPYKCNVCQSAFADMGTLKKHTRRIHSTK